MCANKAIFLLSIVYCHDVYTMYLGVSLDIVCRMLVVGVVGV